MQANERELAMALRGGVRGRFRHSFHLLENAFEVLDDQMAHCVTPTEYETLRPLLAQITEQLAACSGWANTPPMLPLRRCSTRLVYRGRWSCWANCGN